MKLKTFNMKHAILILTLAFFGASFCNAQEIETKKVFGGYLYSQNGEKLTMDEMVKTIESHPEALALMKKAKSQYLIASILGATSGVLIGLPIGSAIAGGDPNWVLAGIGAGVFAVGLPISSGVNKKSRRAVELYNSSLDSSYNQLEPEFNFVANENGIGLSINF